LRSLQPAWDLEIAVFEAFCTKVKSGIFCHGPLLGWAYFCGDEFHDAWSMVGFTRGHYLMPERTDGQKYPYYQHGRDGIAGIKERLCCAGCWPAPLQDMRGLANMLLKPGRRARNEKEIADMLPKATLQDLKLPDGVQVHLMQEDVLEFASLVPHRGAPRDGVTRSSWGRGPKSPAPSVLRPASSPQKPFSMVQRAASSSSKAKANIFGSSSDRKMAAMARR